MFFVIAKMFGKSNGSKSVSCTYPNNAGNILRCRIRSLNCGSIPTKPRKKEVLSFFDFSGNASRNFIEFMSILSKSGECWKADAVSRSLGYLVRSCRRVSCLAQIMSGENHEDREEFVRRRSVSRVWQFVGDRCGHFDST